jgi:small subunit ribosomal protein S20
MPIIKSAIKRNRQNEKRRLRNRAVRERMKSLIKNMLKTAKSDPKKASEFLPKVYSSIDTACKKNLIHKNNAARKKRRVALAIAEKPKK